MIFFSMLAKPKNFSKRYFQQNLVFSSWTQISCTIQLDGTLEPAYLWRSLQIVILLYFTVKWMKKFSPLSILFAVLVNGLLTIQWNSVLARIAIQSQWWITFCGPQLNLPRISTPCFSMLSLDSIRCLDDCILEDKSYLNIFSSISLPLLSFTTHNLIQFNRFNATLLNICSF